MARRFANRHDVTIRHSGYTCVQCSAEGTIRLFRGTMATMLHISAHARRQPLNSTALRNVCGAALCIATLSAAATPAQADPTLEVLASFEKAHDNGTSPLASVIADSSGNLYGTAVGPNYGTVFEAFPLHAGKAKWKIHGLAKFTGRNEKHTGGQPRGALVMDSSGVLYGTTSLGGDSDNNGTIFQVTPPTGGQRDWTFTVLANPPGRPYAGLLRAQDGKLYGTSVQFGGGGAGCTSVCGYVFEVDPPKNGKTKWPIKTIYTFQGGNDGIGPQASLIADPSGALYGTTTLGGATGDGTVFKLTPPAKGQKDWTESVLYTFQGGADGSQPLASLAIDKNGVLYGTTSSGADGGCGTVFSLAPPAGGQTTWAETTLYEFAGPDGCYPSANVILGPGGSLVGTTAGGGANGEGTVFQLTPPAEGQSVWTETLLYSFSGGDGRVPLAGLLQSGSAYFGTTFEGGASGDGTIFKLTP